jgi:hypothetical protein
MHSQLVKTILVFFMMESVMQSKMIKRLEFPILYNLINIFFVFRFKTIIQLKILKHFLNLFVFPDSRLSSPTFTPSAIASTGPCWHTRPKTR